MLGDQRASVIGSGPNGLSAAIRLARAGIATTVYEAETAIGGGARSAALTLPGFVHDTCSAVHPLAAVSPAFAAFDLARHGLEWIAPPVALAHPLDDGSAVTLDASLDATCERLGADGAAWRRVVGPLVAHWTSAGGAGLGDAILQPPLAALGERAVAPAALLGLARFGVHAMLPAAAAARHRFKTEAARALFAGLAAHSILPLEMPGSSAIGWILAACAHLRGWPIPRGGAQRITDALAACLAAAGGRIEPGVTVGSLAQIGASDGSIVMGDITPRQLFAIAGHQLPAGFCRALARYRYGPGVFKLDYALRAPIPWKAEACTRAGTVHLGGTLEEIAASERAAWKGALAPHPFVLLAQPSLFDASRAPAGHHVAWAYCHVPHGSTADCTAAIEAQIERYAPGFRDLVLARRSASTADLAAHNANLIGGDIAAGAHTPMQVFFRPTRRLYATPLRGVYLCGASTPPGAGVHGMCGWNAAQRALRECPRH